MPPEADTVVVSVKVDVEVTVEPAEPTPEPEMVLVMVSVVVDPPTVEVTVLTACPETVWVTVWVKVVAADP